MMAEDHKENRGRGEPYRLFFLVGILLSILGVLPWIFLQLGVVLIPNPMLAHSRLMFHGFLGAFVAGFLMTAVPRMSGTEPAGRYEAIGILLALIVHAVAIILNHERLAAFGLFLAMLQVLFFIGRRFLKKQQNPPAMFLFVPFGLISVVLGSAWMAFGDATNFELNAYAKKLVFEGFILNLVLGLGGRLIPMLCRVKGALSPHQSGGPGWLEKLPTILLLNLSFPVEIFYSRELGQLIKAVTVLDAVIRGYRVFSPVMMRTNLGISLRLAASLLTLGFVLDPLFPQYELHLLHLSYIGGFSLMTLMISVRVILSHGDLPMTIEVDHRGLLLVGALFFLTALTRTGLPVIWPSLTYQFAATASLLWLAGLIAWWMSVGRKIDRVWSVVF